MFLFTFLVFLLKFKNMYFYVFICKLMFLTFIDLLML